MPGSGFEQDGHVLAGLLVEEAVQCLSDTPRALVDPIAHVRAGVRHQKWDAKQAAAIELVQAASLLHDDIVDDCAMRRGYPALHQALGARSAILNGALLVQLAFTLIAELPAAARARIADTAQEVTRGQFLEIMRAFDPTLLPADRLAISGQKTASVFSRSIK